MPVAGMPDAVQVLLTWQVKVPCKPVMASKSVQLKVWAAQPLRR